MDMCVTRACLLTCRQLREILFALRSVAVCLEIIRHRHRGKEPAGSEVISKKQTVLEREEASEKK